jgi:hypothetical protein
MPPTMPHPVESLRDAAQRLWYCIYVIGVWLESVRVGPRGLRRFVLAAMVSVGLAPDASDGPSLEDSDLFSLVVRSTNSEDRE